jgi:LPXTG-motif cell wall-anchored protein
MPFATLAERGSRRATPCETLAMVRRMPVHRRRLAALVAAGLLAAPASALGQSAGDEQYQDPFAGEEQGGSGDEGTQAPEPAPEPAAPAAPAPEPAPSSTGSDPTAPEAQAELPRTGADTGLILLGGTILVAGGVALRVRLRERPER